MTILKLIIIASIISGVLVSLQLMRKPSVVKHSNKILAWFVLFISITLAGRYFYTMQPLTILWVKILFIGDFLIFSFGPLLYLYLCSLFSFTPRYNIKPGIHFIPLILYVLFVLPSLFFSPESFIQFLKFFNVTFHVIELFAIIQNIFYLILGYKIVQNYTVKSGDNQSAVPNLVLINTLLFIIVGAIIVWLISYFVRIFFPEQNEDFLGYQVVWFSLSFIVMLLSYMVLVFPSLFKFESLKSNGNEIKNRTIEDFANEIATLDNIMREEKPYLNPKITLGELAEVTGIGRNLLSRIINEYYRKNFFDFINSYRINEFKQIAENGENKNLTLLALAYRSGFNSKTTFNTAFKKLTNKTPGQYYRHIEKSTI